jgi:DNA-binding transcriptional LysR family regulator
VLALPLLAFAPLATRELGDPPVSRDIVALTRTKGPPAPPVRRFLDALHAHLGG